MYNFKESKYGNSYLTNWVISRMHRNTTIKQNISISRAKIFDRVLSHPFIRATLVGKGHPFTLTPSI